VSVVSMWGKTVSELHLVSVPRRDMKRHSAQLIGNL
jgi:hypothetical protein